MDLSIFESALRAAVGVTAVYYCLAAVGLNVQFGYAGLLNFGQAAFLAVGGYGLAASIIYWDFPFFGGIAFGLLLSVILALLLGIPTLRLRADYLAIATIATAEAIRLFVGAAYKDVFRGRDGLSGFTQAFVDRNPYTDSFLGFRPNDLWVMTIGWILIAITSLFVWLLMRSPWGRVLKAIREDEEAVRSLGKNVYAYKMQALVLGGVIGCLGGFILALGQNSVQPDNFNSDLTFIVYTILILGGAARVIGPIFGAVAFWGVYSLGGSILRELTRGVDPVIPRSIMESNDVGNVQFMLTGLALMLLIVYRPQGVFGDRKEIALDAR
ncbi:branched-chain amino acid transport system permease protein [Mumia flava]|uniref:Branched-chain amino acid transport system permease protein n=1 Tax=Mumia flava TaxID=1348852 RepID=A0A0B2BV99_9ACTN|nr:branched-chain amino acid ABC transporter permease [Mumia flava]PJJ55976.1 branched-chain amino acid transport system permease protein [Mumia flava]